MSFGFSQRLDAESIRAGFNERGFVHIPSVLPIENANRISKVLIEGTPWNLVFNEGEKHFDLSVERLATMRKSDLQRLQQAILGQASHGFQYVYYNYPIFDAFREGKNEGHVLHRFYEWLNSEEFLAFARRATGFDDISFVDAQATRYGPGHFLSTHDDIQAGKNRRAAYIFNFTKTWSEDWGGYLQLLDDRGDIRYGLMPTFNALNILKIPQRHQVSFVTPFARSMRFSVSGWFRSG